MAEIKKTQKPKPVARETTPKPKTQKEQSERFIATARELGCDESSEAFEKTFSKITRNKISEA